MAGNTFAKMIKDKIIKLSPKGYLIQLDNIHIRPGFNRRMDTPENQAKNDKLFDYMMGEGAIIPELEVVARPEGGVWVVEGHRRTLMARRCREAGKPIEWIKITEFVGNDIDQVARIATSNNQEKLSDLELSFVVKDLNILNLKETEIAKKLNLQLPKVKDLLQLATANHDVHELLMNEKISTAHVVARVQEHGSKAAEKLKEDVAKTKASGKNKTTTKTAGVKNPVAAKFGAASAKNLAFMLSSADVLQEENRDIIVLPKGTISEVMSILGEAKEFLANKAQEGDKKKQLEISETKTKAKAATDKKPGANKKANTTKKSNVKSDSENNQVDNDTDLSRTKSEINFEVWCALLSDHAKNGNVELSNMEDWREDYENGLTPEEALL